MSVCSEFFQENPFDFSSRHQIPQDKIRLLDHYKSKTDLYQQQRLSNLSRIQEFQQQLSDYHKFLNQSKQKSDQIFALQTQLAEVQQAIFAQRQQVLELNRENQLLKIRESEEQKKIFELKVMVNSNQKLTFFKDSRPGKKNNTQNYNQSKLCQSQAGPNYNNKVGKFKSNSKHLLRTVYLPNERLNGAALEVELLRKQLAEQKQIYDSELKALLQENKIRENESEIRAQVDFEKLREFTRLAALQEENGNQMTKEYFKVRYELQQTEEILKKRLENLRNQTNLITKEYITVKTDNKRNNSQVQRVNQQKSNHYSSRFRKMAMNSQENLEVMKVQYQQLQEMYSEKITELEESIADASEKYRQLVGKRKRIQNKFRNQIKTVSEVLRGLEQKQERPVSKRQPRQTFKPPRCHKCKLRSPYNQ